MNLAHLSHNRSTWRRVLRLDCRRMDSTVMQRFLYLGRNVHEIVLPQRGDVDGGDNFGL